MHPASHGRAATVPMRRYDWERLIFRLEKSLEFKAIAWAMAQFANQDGSRVRPGRDLIADGLERSGRRIGDYLTEMLDLGLLTVSSRGGGRGGAGTHTVYYLSMPALGALPMRLDVDLNRITPRPAGRRPNAALEAAAAKRFGRNPVSSHSGAVPTIEEKPTSGETPAAPSNEGKPDSGQNAPAHSNDEKPASRENDFQRKPEADWEETEPLLRGSQASHYQQTNVTKPLSVVHLTGPLTSNGPPDPAAATDPPPAVADPPLIDETPAALSLAAQYQDALGVMNLLDPDNADAYVRQAREELRSEGAELGVRALVVRAADIATRPDPDTAP